jgi:hypothetical protein
MGDRGAEAAEDAAQIDVEEGAPALVLELVARDEAGDRRVREHDVDAAEALGCRVEQVRHLVGAAHVHRHDERVAARGRDRIRDGLDVVRIAGEPARRRRR